MDEDQRHTAGSSDPRSSSMRRVREERSPDRDRHRHRDAKSRREDDRNHTSRSDHKNEDRHRRNNDKEKDRSRHHDRHHHHSSSSHHKRSPASRDPRRERVAEEHHSERTRRHGEDGRESKSSHEDAYRRHKARSYHEGDLEGPGSSRRSRSDKDRPHRRSQLAEVAARHDRQPATDLIPTSKSLDLTSQAAVDETTGEAGSVTTTANSESTLKRDDWMLSGREANELHHSDLEGNGHADDAAYFSSLGTARIKAPRPEKPDPEKLKISSRELNTQLKEGKTVDEYEAPTSAASRPEFGAPGHQWRMMKLKRTIEAAEQEGRRVEEVALERYGNLDDFEHALAERRFLDGKGQGQGRRVPSERNTPTLQSVARRSYLLASGGAGDSDGAGSSKSGTDSPNASRPASRHGFRRPGESSNPATPTPAASAQPARPPRNIGFETPSSKPATPTAIPSVFTPVVERPAAPPTSSGKQPAIKPQQGVVLDDGSSDPDRPILTADQLNKLQAKILQAELMGYGQLDTLKAEYERESARANAHRSVAGDRGGAFAPSSTKRSRDAAQPSTSAGVLVQDGERELQVLPTLDARGRMYDIGSLAGEDADPANPGGSNGKRRKLKGRDEFEARDPKTGEIVRYSADDEAVSLGDLVRQEKFGAGSRWQKNADAELAANIMSDAGFSQDLEEQDEEAHRYAKKKMRSDALKRQFAINDFARTRKALDQCRYCWQEEGAKPPRVTVISSGYRAYLAVPDVEAITPAAEDHVLIVPMQHHLSLLEADDDTWDEIKNFQKCLVQLAGAQNRRAVFFESVLSLRAQLHSVIEAVLLPADAMSLVPGVFKQSLRSVGGEFSTHAKVIEFSATRPFRNALVPNLPYFAVTWDYRWSSGYGHVIENMQPDPLTTHDQDAFDIDEMSAGTAGGPHGKFDPHFARNIIQSVLEDLETSDGPLADAGGYMRPFGKPKPRSHPEKIRIKHTFTAKGWDSVDWTKMLQHPSPSTPSTM